MAYSYTPSYIKQTVAATAKQVITAERWNELFNLLITQGDNTAAAIKAFIDDLNADGADNVGTTYNGSTMDLQSALNVIAAAITARYTSTEVTAYITAAKNDCVTGITFDEDSGKFTIAKGDGTSTEIDTNIEKIPASLTLETEDGVTKLVITNDDGTETSADISSLLVDYSFTGEGGITVSCTTTTGSKAYTISLPDGSVTSDKLAANLQTTLEGYKTSAETAASSADSNATTATTKASEAAASATEAAASAATASSAATTATEAATTASSAATTATAAATTATAAAESASAGQLQADWNQTDTTKKDFIKNKPTIPAEQLQADWNQTDTTKKDFIKNKPTIPEAAPTPQIGDIKTTLRADLDSTWLLCNGDVVTNEDYPDLTAQLLKDFGKNIFTSSTAWSGDASELKCAAYANGYWVVGGYYKSGSTYKACIAYATSLSGPWTVKDLWSHYQAVCCVNCITYADGHWVVGGCYKSGTAYRAAIAYATTPDGTWTTKDVHTNSAPCSMNCITYADGYWVAGVSSGSRYTYVVYATSLSENWLMQDIWLSNNETSCLNCITHADGYWVVGGRHDDTTACIAYATALNGTWTTKDLWETDGNTYKSCVNCITYADGHWVVGGRHSDDDGVAHACVGYTTTLDGTWKEKTLWTGYQDTTAVQDILYHGGYWTAFGALYASSATADPGTARIANATVLNSAWTAKDVWECVGAKANFIAFADDTCVLGGAAVEDQADVYYGTGDAYLPTVAHEGAYTYVKASTNEEG